MIWGHPHFRKPPYVAWSKKIINPPSSHLQLGRTGGCGSPWNTMLHHGPHGWDADLPGGFSSSTIQRCECSPGLSNVHEQPGPKSPGLELDTWKYSHGMPWPRVHPPVAAHPAHPLPVRLNRKSAASNKSAPESGRSSRKLASWPGNRTALDWNGISVP